LWRSPCSPRCICLFRSRGVIHDRPGRPWSRPAAWPGPGIARHLARVTPGPVFWSTSVVPTPDPYSSPPVLPVYRGRLWFEVTLRDYDSRCGPFVPSVRPGERGMSWAYVSDTGAGAVFFAVVIPVPAAWPGVESPHGVPISRNLPGLRSAVQRRHCRTCSALSGTRSPGRPGAPRGVLACFVPSRRSFVCCVCPSRERIAAECRASDFVGCDGRKFDGRIAFAPRWLAVRSELAVVFQWVRRPFGSLRLCITAVAPGCRMWAWLRRAWSSSIEAGVCPRPRVVLVIDASF